MKAFIPLPSWKTVLLSVFIIPLFLVLSALTAIQPAWATGVYDLPRLNVASSTYLIDQAEAISRANEGTINNDFKKLAQKTGQEVRFVVIRRLNFDETIDQLADKLFQTWYATPEEQANQTLLVMDTLTNSTAIRRGEAVKSLLTDDIADSVTSETVAIPLREGGKYNQALLGADKRLVAVLSGEVDPGPPSEQTINLESTFTSAEDTDDKSATLWIVVFLALATIIPMVTYFWYVGFPGR